MIGFLRLALFGAIAMSVVYVVVSIYSRSVRREELEKDWDTDPAREGLPEAERRTHIDAGMAAYEKGLRRKLIWLVFVIPTVAVAVTIYIVNAQ
jgi:Ca2+/Na+ antiporter